MHPRSILRYPSCHPSKLMVLGFPRHDVCIPHNERTFCMNTSTITGLLLLLAVVVIGTTVATVVFYRGWLNWIVPNGPGSTTT